MSTILLVTSSASGAASYSTKVARALVARLQADNPAATVTVRDLAAAPLPHVDDAFVTALRTPAAQRNDAQAAAIARSDALIAELTAADTVVIASPMINFGLASTLKAWFDHVIRAGATFNYTEKGPAGLLAGKRVYLVPARGGVYSEGPYKPYDFQEPYLRQLLGFIGLTDVVSVPVEGVAMGPEAAEKALAGALARIPSVVAQAA